MATNPVESLAAVAESVSASSTKTRIRIFRDEIPSILDNTRKRFWSLTQNDEISYCLYVHGICVSIRNPLVVYPLTPFYAMLAKERKQMREL